MANAANVLERIARGAAFSALAGGVTMGLAYAHVPGLLAAAASGYAAGVCD